MGSLTPEEINDALSGLDGWTFDGSVLAKTYEFDDFAAAIDFMTRARPGVDELDHHPEWTNVYNRVDVRLSSHDVDAVTDRDVRLAQLLDGVAGAAE